MTLETSGGLLLMLGTVNQVKSKEQIFHRGCLRLLKLVCTLFTTGHGQLCPLPHELAVPATVMGNRDNTSTSVAENDLLSEPQFPKVLYDTVLPW